MDNDAKASARTQVEMLLEGLVKKPVLSEEEKLAALDLLDKLVAGSTLTELDVDDVERTIKPRLPQVRNQYAPPQDNNYSR